MRACMQSSSDAKRHRSRKSFRHRRTSCCAHELTTTSTPEPTGQLLAIPCSPFHLLTSMVVECGTLYSPVHALPSTQVVKSAATGNERELSMDYSNSSWKQLDLEQPQTDSDCVTDNRFHPTPNQTDMDFAMHDFLVQDDLNDPNHCTHSPSSSPSTQSFRSASFHSPEESDSGQQMYYCGASGSTPTHDHDHHHHHSNSYPQTMSSEETGFEQFVALNSPTLLFGDHGSQGFLDSYILSDLDDDEEDEKADKRNDTQIGDQGTTGSTKTRSDSVTAVDPKCDQAEGEKRQPSSDSVHTTRPPGRPQTLSFRSSSRECSRTFGSLNPTNDMPLSFTNATTPFFGLEEQLASVDIAWMGALDIPNICLDEVEKILSPNSCLTSPVKDPPLNLSGSSAGTQPRNQSTLPASRRGNLVENAPRLTDQASQCNLIESRLISMRSTESVDSSNGEKRRSADPGLLTSSSSNESFNLEKTDLHRKIPRELADSDSTLTCSEAEYYSNWIEQHSKRARRKRGHRRARPDHVTTQTDSDSDSGTDEPREWNASLLRRLSSGSGRYGSRNRGKCHRRPTKSPSEADMKPWWPKSNASSFWGGCGISVDIPQSIDESESISPYPALRIDDDDADVDAGDQIMPSSISDTEAPQSNDSGCVSGSPHSSPNANSLRSHREASQNGPKSKASRRLLPDRVFMDSRGQQAIWRTRRRRKQLELWQFILCKLETSKQSAFQWVNRSAGVFCITDTIAGAREWGRYRNNSRMDYEKMARAMRFYYKDSILRKAKQQLHFQFAMSYVEWASRFYHAV